MADVAERRTDRIDVRAGRGALLALGLLVLALLLSAGAGTVVALSPAPEPTGTLSAVPLETAGTATGDSSTDEPTDKLARNFAKPHFLLELTVECGQNRPSVLHREIADGLPIRPTKAATRFPPFFPTFVSRATMGRLRFLTYWMECSTNR